MNPKFNALEYTRNALAKELYLIELHAKDGSAIEANCACIQEKHLYGIEGLSLEGILMTKNEAEKEFYEKLSLLTRELRKNIVYAKWDFPIVIKKGNNNVVCHTKGHSIKCQ